jgi:hypothetical protein
MKRHFIFLSSILLLLSVLELLSCQKNKTAFPVLDCNSLSDTAHIHYAPDTVFDPNSIQLLVVDYCSYQSGCHEEGSLNGDYTTYAGIKAKVSNGSLYQRVVVQRDMPPTFSGETLDSCQIKEFYLWIKEGGPEY